MSTQAEQRQRLQKKLEDAPGKLQAYLLKEFDRMQFESEVEFEHYLSGIVEFIDEYTEDTEARAVRGDILRWSGKSSPENEASSMDEGDKILSAADVKEWREASKVINGMQAPKG